MTDQVIRRDGFRIIAELRPGATVRAIEFGDQPCFVVAHPEEKPYIIRIDGSKEVIEAMPDSGPLP